MALTTLNNNSLHAITDGSALKNITGTVLQVVQFVWLLYPTRLKTLIKRLDLRKRLHPNRLLAIYLSIFRSILATVEQMLLKMHLLFIEAHLSSKRMKEEYLQIRRKCSCRRQYFLSLLDSLNNIGNNLHVVRQNKWRNTSFQ